MTIYRQRHTNSIHSYLAGDCDLVIVLKADGRLLLVGIAKDDGDGGLGDAGLTALVHQILQVLGADLRKGV